MNYFCGHMGGHEHTTPLRGVVRASKTPRTTPQIVGFFDEKVDGSSPGFWTGYVTGNGRLGVHSYFRAAHKY